VFIETPTSYEAMLAGATVFCHGVLPGRNSLSSISIYRLLAAAAFAFFCGRFCIVPMLE
jgi:hypothetical protein